MKVGVQTRIGKVLPGSRYLEAVKLSRQAKTQLVWMDYYEQCGNAALTCRRFGVSRPTLHKWLKRYRPKDLLSLEDRSRRPKKTRKPTTPLKTVGLVKTLRTKHPEYSKYKLSVIIRDYSLEVSPSITGRIISQHNLFRPKSSKRSRRPIRPGLPKTLKPKGLKATKPGQIFEFDLKHLRSYLGRKLYAFVAVDTFTKKIFIMVSSSISSKQAALAWEGGSKALGTPEIVVTDHAMASSPNGCRPAPPTTSSPGSANPKDKAFVERVIGSYETECLALGGLADTVGEQQRITNAWLAKYHYYRPHAALNYLTPHEFSSRMEANEV